MVRENQNGAGQQQTTEQVNGKAEPRRSFFSRLRRYTPEPLSVDSVEANHPLGAPVLDLDDQTFFDALSDCVTVVDFWAPWCRPCKILQPRFDDIARTNVGNPRLQFVRVNVDESPGVASAFDVMSIPTLVVFDQMGREIDREVGVPGKRRLTQLSKGANSAADTMNERGNQ